MKSLLAHIRRHALQIPGPRFPGRFLVIESDDWGTIRMASRQAFSELLAQGYPVDKNAYCQYDRLESNADMEALIEAMLPVRDGQGKPAKLTANMIMGNPDFDAIRSSSFEQYAVEPFYTTLTRYPEHHAVMDLYRQGMKAGCVQPQFHGREHLQVHRWMDALRAGDKPAHDGFQKNMFSFSWKFPADYANEYMDALELDSSDEIEFQKTALKQGLDWFESCWGFKSTSFIAPCYIWSTELEKTLSEQGVRLIQGMVNQFHPLPQKGTQIRKIYHYQGQKNALGQRYLVRNVFFEPSLNPKHPWEKEAMERIALAFSYGKPAIVCSHRLNFMGSLVEKNRTENLVRLVNLLKAVVKRWPDVQFVSTDELNAHLS